MSGYDFVKGIKEDKNVEGFVRIIINCKSDIGESEIFIDTIKEGTWEYYAGVHGQDFANNIKDIITK